MTQRQEAKERTRKKLLRSIVEILDEEGDVALTTVRITQRAGVAQPTFYVHFTDVETGVAFAAEDMAARIVALLRAPSARAGGAPVSLRAALQAVLEAFLEDRRLTRVFLRHRRDVRSPFGQRFGAILARAREFVVDECRRVGAQRPEIVAMLVVSLFIGTLEAVLDGRIASTDEALDDLTHAVNGMIRPPSRG